MNYRLFASKVELPEVGLGTWKYSGGPAPLRHGIELGSTLIDTAESYGSEEIVGEAIRGVRHKVFLATKISPLHFRRSDVKMAAEGSLKRLKTDYIDLYQLHWPNTIVPLEETMSAMEDLANEGKIRFIGVSNFMLRELRRSQAALSRHKIFSNQLRYSLIDRTIEGRLLEYCQQNQIAIIAFTPLGHGLDHVAKMDPEGRLDRIAKQCGKTRAQVALNWCLSKQSLITIPKASTIEHVAEDCGASGWTLSLEQLRELSAGIRFRRRGALEIAVRRAGRYLLQRIGREPA